MEREVGLLAVPGITGRRPIAAASADSVEQAPRTEDDVAEAQRAAVRPPAVTLGAVELDPPMTVAVAELGDVALDDRCDPRGVVDTPKRVTRWLPTTDRRAAWDDEASSPPGRSWRSFSRS